MWRNEYEIEEIGLGVLRIERLQPWYLVLLQWVNIVNTHSDGWAYWKVGSNAGEMLGDLLARAAGMAYLSPEDPKHYRWDRPAGTWEPTDAELRASLRGMKSLVTRRANEGKSAIPLPAGFARVLAGKPAPEKPVTVKLSQPKVTLQTALW